MNTASIYNLKKRRLGLMVGTLVLVGGGVAFLSTIGGVDWPSLLETFQRYHLLVLVPALSAVLIQVFFQAQRLWILMPPNASLKWSKCVRAFSYGQFLNALVPARAGDLVKGLYLSRKNSRDGRDVPLSEALGVLIADRIVDSGFFMGLVVIAMGLNSAQFVTWLSQRKMPSPVLIGSAALLILGIVWLIKNRYTVLPKASKNFLLGLGILKNPRTVLLGGLCALLAWFSEMWALHLICQAQGIVLSFDELVWVLAILNIGIAVPVSAANVGTFEALITFALVRLGVPLPQALSVATVHHILQVLGVALWAMGMWAGYRLVQTSGTIIDDSLGSQELENPVN